MNSADDSRTSHPGPRPRLPDARARDRGDKPDLERELDEVLAELLASAETEDEHARRALDSRRAPSGRARARP
jgi:hypothetical protein